MSYYVGDVPSEDLVVEPARDGEPIDLAPFTTIDTEVQLRAFDGTLVPADFTVAFVDGGEDDTDQVILEWPEGVTPFATPGLYTLTVTLVGPDHRERLAPVYLVAQGDDGWHTIDSARDEWSSAASIPDARLFGLLELAREQITAAANERLADGARPPFRFRAGQLAQARNLLNSALADPASGGASDDEFTLKAYPVDWMIEQTINPKRSLTARGIA